MNKGYIRILVSMRLRSLRILRRYAPDDKRARVDRQRDLVNLRVARNLLKGV
jgi:hypothetical protein